MSTSTSTPACSKELALKLKDEGNAFLAKGELEAAYEKYTEAIAEDKDNAVLFANRSACLLSMKRNEEALRDALMATTLDLLYNKAWARYAAACEALNSWEEALFGWKKALATLARDPTPAEKKLKAQYEARLNIANRKVKKIVQERESRTPSKEELEDSFLERLIIKDGATTPWVQAEKLIPKLKGTTNVNSSAWVIYYAYLDFRKGMDMMSSIRTENGKLFGELGAIEAILKGILRDTRVFHLRSKDEYAKFADQIKFENQEYKGWANTKLTIEEILDQAQRRLKKERWDTIRPALNITIQSWVLQGFLWTHEERDDFAPEHFDGFELYGKSIDLLAAAEELWKDVKPIEKGQVFRQWFRRGIKSLRLTTFNTIYFWELRLDDDPDYNLKGLKALCEELADEKALEGHDPKDSVSDPGSQYSFYIYPMTLGITTLGRELMEPIRKGIRTKKAQAQAQEALQIYLKAVSLLPPDDEYHFELMSSLFEVMEIVKYDEEKRREYMASVREHKEQMEYIWGHASDQDPPNKSKKAKDAETEGMSERAEKIRGLLEQGILPSWTTTSRKTGEPEEEKVSERWIY